MIPSLRIPMIVGSAIMLLIMVRFGYAAATESDGPRKGKARLIATLVFGSWFCAMGAVMAAYNETRPNYESTGIIQSLQVIHSDSRHYSAYLHIAVPTSGSIYVHVSDRSAYFRPGERLWLRYQGDTGELLNAIFFAVNGNQEGVFRSTQIYVEIGGILLGSFLIWVAFKKYRRDPEGSES